MGWFDGDSSDDNGNDEKEAAKKKPLLLQLDDNDDDHAAAAGIGAPSTSNTNQNDAAAGEGEEEEDPLDAYMKSLESKPASTSSSGAAAAAAAAGDVGSTTTTASTTTKKATRLDLENEDEATSHWRASNKRKNRLDNDNIEGHTIIHGELDQDGFGGRTHNDDADDDDDADNNNNIQYSKEMDIELDRIDHSKMRYEDFERVFWKPPPHQQSTTSDRDKSWRKKHGVTVHGSSDGDQDGIHTNSNNTITPPIHEFSDLKEVLEESLLETIQRLGYQHPTPVQAQTLPVAMSGRDALITAPTGSGKTLAYVWPMIVHVCAQHHLGAHETGPIGLILVPTRELAQQVQKHVQTMLTPLGGTSLTIIGGMGKYPLTQHLRQKGGVEIVVATPGRLLDVVATQQQQQTVAASQNPRKKLPGLSLERTTMVVLDESDRLLHMGFTKQVSQILQNIRPNRQTLMLSATMSHRIENVAKQWLGAGGEYNKGSIGGGRQSSSYVRIAIGRTGQASLHVKQHVMVVPSIAAKLSWLQQMLPVLCQVGRTLVFCATKEGCEQLAKEVKLPDDIVCVTLHGDKHQSDRNKALRKFVKQQRVVLIATDVASRGLDIPHVTTVINYDPPKNLDVHVHRVGRAGRLSASKNIGKDDNTADQQPNEGSAYTLLRTPKDADIGSCLLGAMEREDRPVPEELRQLAKLSRQDRGGNASNSNAPDHSRNRWNTSGPGSAVASRGDGYSRIVNQQQQYQPPQGDDAYYGPPSQQPPEKKSRWL